MRSILEPAQINVQKPSYESSKVLLLYDECLNFFLDGSIHRMSFLFLLYPKFSPANLRFFEVEGVLRLAWSSLTETLSSTISLSPSPWPFSLLINKTIVLRKSTDQDLAVLRIQISPFMNTIKQKEIWSKGSVLKIVDIWILFFTTKLQDPGFWNFFPRARRIKRFKYTKITSIFQDIELIFLNKSFIQNYSKFSFGIYV